MSGVAPGRAGAVGILLLGAISLGHPGAAVGQVSAETALSRMAWLVGCWEGRSESRVTEEHWFPPRGGTMLGSARAISDDRTTSVELTVLRMAGDTLIYHACPVGQSPAVFPATAVDDSGATFANPEHDFPQRIIYRRIGADSLLARVEGPLRGRQTAVDYAMRRVRCPASP